MKIDTKVEFEFALLAKNLWVPAGTLEGLQLSALLEKINDEFTGLRALHAARIDHRDKKIADLYIQLEAADDALWED